MRNVKIASAILLVIALGAFSSCGNTEDYAPTHTVGTAGPSSPSGYYIDLTASPYIITGSGVISFTTRVTDVNGTAVAGVVINYTGDADTGGVATSDASGYATAVLSITSGGGTWVGYITASVQDLNLTVPYQVVE